MGNKLVPKFTFLLPISKDSNLKFSDKNSDIPRRVWKADEGTYKTVKFQ